MAYVYAHSYKNEFELLDILFNIKQVFPNISTAWEQEQLREKITANANLSLFQTSASASKNIIIVDTCLSQTDIQQLERVFEHVFLLYKQKSCNFNPPLLALPAKYRRRIKPTQAMMYLAQQLPGINIYERELKHLLHVLINSLVPTGEFYVNLWGLQQLIKKLHQLSKKAKGNAFVQQIKKYLIPNLLSSQISAFNVIDLLIKKVKHPKRTYLLLSQIDLTDNLFLHIDALVVTYLLQRHPNIKLAKNPYYLKRLKNLITHKNDVDIYTLLLFMLEQDVIKKFNHPKTIRKQRELPSPMLNLALITSLLHANAK